MPAKMDLDALQEALKDDGKISEAEREKLIMCGIPDMLLEALEDGVLDETERRDLQRLGIPKKVLDALADGNLSDEEKSWMKKEFAQQLKSWQQDKLKELLSAFDRAYKK